MTQVSMSPHALLEAEEARQWYDERKSGLGKEFVEALDETLKRVQNYPTAYPPTGGRFRKCRLNRFPYSVVYELRPDGVQVLSVFHSARNPADLQKLFRKS